MGLQEQGWGALVPSLGELGVLARSWIDLEFRTLNFFWAYRQVTRLPEIVRGEFVLVLVYVVDLVTLV